MVPKRPRDAAAFADGYVVLLDYADYIGEQGKTYLITLSYISLILMLSPAIVLLNVLDYYESLRAMTEHAVDAGFIDRCSRGYTAVKFVDQPTNHDNMFDWGEAALSTLENWKEHKE